MNNPTDVDDALLILVVEDDPVYADFVSRTLRDAGHDVEMVSTGAKAREKAPTMRPDAVMLDLGLPDDDGYELARWLRGTLPSASVIIVLTASSHPQLDLAAAFGVDMVLTKPVDPSVVAGMIDHVRVRRQRKLGQPV